MEIECNNNIMILTNVLELLNLIKLLNLKRKKLQEMHIELKKIKQITISNIFHNYYHLIKQAK